MKKRLFGGLPPLLLLALLCSACKKDSPAGSPPPEGYVLEYGTETPIPDAQVQVYGNCQSELLGSINCELLETVTSDQNGAYKANFPAFEVLAIKDGYHTEFVSSSAIVQDGSEKTTNIHLTPYAWLKVTLVNESGAEVIYVDGGHYLQLGEQKVMVSQELGNKEYLLPFAVYLLEGGIQQYSVKSLAAHLGSYAAILPRL